MRRLGNNIQHNNRFQGTLHKVSGPLNRDVGQIIMNINIFTLIVLTASLIQARAGDVYEISFDNYAVETSYIRGTAPAEFSGTSFNAGNGYPPYADAAIVAQALGLNEQPLVQHTYSANESIYYEMAFDEIGSNIIDFGYQLALDTTSEASIEFRSTLEDSSLAWLFAHFIGDTVTISSRESILFLPTILYETTSPINRSAPMDIDISMNTFGNTFSFSINGISYAADAPLASSQIFTHAIIGLGDVVGASGGFGDSAIDNISLSVNAIPEPATSSLLLISSLALFIHTRNRKAQQGGPGYPPQGVGSPDP